MFITLSENPAMVLSINTVYRFCDNQHKNKNLNLHLGGVQKEQKMQGRKKSCLQAEDVVCKRINALLSIPLPAVHVRCNQKEGSANADFLSAV